MYPVEARLHILPDVLGQSSGACLESSFFGTLPAGWISQQTLWDQQAKLYFIGIPRMRTITATAAFMMRLPGIGLLLSALPGIPDSKQASKPLFIKACFYPPGVFPVTNSTKFPVFKMLCLCVLRINIISIFMPRISTM